MADAHTPERPLANGQTRETLRRVEAFARQMPLDLALKPLLR